MCTIPTPDLKTLKSERIFKQSRIPKASSYQTDNKQAQLFEGRFEVKSLIQVSFSFIPQIVPG